jgi:glutamate decarboxylase
VWQSAGMALHGQPVPRRHHESREANAFLGSANPAFEREISAPLHELPPGPVPADVAYQLIHDELLIDGSARLNLATFVTT